MVHVIMKYPYSRPAQAQPRDARCEPQVGPQAGLARVEGGGEEGHRQPRRHHRQVGQNCQVG